MPDDSVKLAYLGKVPVTLPDGTLVHGKVLTLKRALEYGELYEAQLTGDAKARMTIAQEFPAEVGLEDELNQLTMEEFWEVFNCFFGKREFPTTNGQPSSGGPQKDTPDPASSLGT